MLSRCCDGFARRDFVRVGALTAFGLGSASFGRMQRARAQGLTKKHPAKSCILIWLDGGPSHLDTFDPKPEAPLEVRGPLEAIRTNVAGIQINECLEQTSQMMDRLCLIRSMTSSLGEHNFGTHYLMTGYKPSPALDYPTIGSTVASLRQGSGVLPPFISAPGFDATVSGNGFLPASFAPFVVGDDFRVRNLDFYKDVDLDRIHRRRDIVNAFDRFSKAQEASPTAGDTDLARAYDLITSPDAKKAFDLSDESTQTHQRYGRNGGNGLGQGCLLARRLIERGVPFVTVNGTGWDTHRNVIQLKKRFPSDQSAHLPSLDRALSALIGDLSDRGLLDETLVIVMGEFGRTPKINPAGGRDHWPNVFSVLLAGGGVRGGQVIGTSDTYGEFPKDNPVTPSDLSATVFTLLGIDPTAELHTGDGRPVRIAPDGAQVIETVMG